ncbi:serine-rich and transmembrane domain-containing protein 1 isoform X1 [Trachinotus anak]|uniref:serine-rich and transmembrane domain-containing protein 1 isoform X1 n=2 Tax=Trachinotus anak TaxID=443729 RepID=UPI0039F1DF39
MWLKALVSASICHAEVSWREKLNPWQLQQTKENFSYRSARMSGMDVPLVDHNETGLSPIDNGTFLRFSPTSASTSAAASSPGRPGNVYVYVWLFLGLLVFLLTLLIISLHRLKNIISSSSSSVPDCSSEGGSSFTNMEICSISSQRSTISSLST